MATTEDIQSKLRAKPFQPFHIIASENQRFDIHHPDLVWVGRRDLHIGFAAPDAPTVYDRVIRLALVHVVGMEDIPTKTSTSSNGQD